MPLVQYRAVGSGKRVMQIRPHPGQMQALRSQARTVLMLAGTQGGKSSIGPLLLFQEMKRRGPGDYLVVTPTYPLLELKALPEFRTLFETTLHLGRYHAQGRSFEVDRSAHRRLFGDTPHAGDTETGTRVLFGHAQDPDSLEAATAKAAWMDEAGQKRFKLASYEAIQRRLAIHEGREFITTTPYNLGWLKTELHDRAVAGDADVDLVRFASIMNPAFPRASWERARARLPRWKFDMFYRAIFTRPAGLIYDSFNEADVVTPFQIPAGWPRFWGFDFGGVNTAVVFFAREPGTGVLYAYREYWPQEKRTAAQHAKALLAGEPGLPERAVGGAPSEDHWRLEFAQTGIPIQRPRIGAIEVGIDRVWAQFEARKIRVFSTLRYLLDELRSYSRELDESGEPTEDIEDKETFHLSDATRYILSDITGDESAWSEARAFTGSTRRPARPEHPR